MNYSVCFLSLMLLLALHGFAIGQDLSKPKPRPEQTTPAVQPGKQTESFALTVVRHPPLRLSLRAKNAPLPDIITELARQLQIPVRLSPELRKRHVTLLVEDAPLETLLSELAPQGYVDYLLHGGWQSQPDCVGIYLQVLNETPPSPHASLPTHAESFLFEGDTESTTSTTTASDEEPPLLQIAVKQGLLHLHARRQPLPVVLYEIASRYKIPFESRYALDQLVNLKLAAVPLHDALRQLPIETQLYYRTSLPHQDISPLRLLLTKRNPGEKTQ